jgi:hypothetical protein
MCGGRKSLGDVYSGSPPMLAEKLFFAVRKFSFSFRETIWNGAITQGWGGARERGGTPGGGRSGRFFTAQNPGVAAPLSAWPQPWAGTLLLLWSNSRQTLHRRIAMCDVKPPAGLQPFIGKGGAITRPSRRAYSCLRQDYARLPSRAMNRRPFGPLVASSRIIGACCPIVFTLMSEWNFEIIAP